MVDLLRPDDWIELRRKRPNSDEAMATLPIRAQDGTESGLLLGVDAAQNMHLLIPVRRGPSRGLPQDLTGMRVRHRQLESGEVLDLMASPAHEQFFSPVCQDVITAVLEQRRDPWRAVDAVIRAWRSALQPVREALEDHLQVGLFGELYVLKNVLLPCVGERAVYSWSGPLSERHDFVTERLRIEVKTTRKSRHQHEISRVDQLDAPDGCQLLLISVQLETSVGGRHSLATLIDELSSDLHADTAALDLLKEKVRDVGWTEDMRHSADLLRFELRDAQIYLVDEEFPRLPVGFRPSSGIIAMRYTVDLANVAALGLDEVLELIGEDLGQAGAGI